MKNITAKILIVLLYTAAAANLSAQTTEDKLVYSEASAASVIFDWAVQGDTLFIKLSAPTTGWIAVGFEPARMMKDADIIIGAVSEGEVLIEDHFGLKPTSHIRDEEIGGTNDVTILGGSEKNGTTTLLFSIPMESMDSFDRKLEKGREYKVIVAYGRNDNLKSYHKKRGSFKITL